MAYTLQAFVAPASGLPAELPPGLRVVVLPGSLVMIPLDTAAREHINVPMLPMTDEGHAELPETLANAARQLSQQSKLIYIEAEFFGGEGGQAAALFDQGRLTGIPCVAPDAINTALRWLGIEVGEHQDEFEAAGLGGRRETDDW